MKLTLTSPAGRTLIRADQFETTIARAATAAVREAANIAVSLGKANIAVALGQRFVSGFRAKFSPATGVALDPAALIYHRFGFVSVFEYGARIGGRPLLWLPLPIVPTVRGRQLTPKQFAASFGRLVSIERPGKPPMLGARVPVDGAGRAVKLTKASLKPGKNPRTAARVRIVPMFVGVRSVDIAKRLDIEAIVKRAGDQVGVFYAENLEAITNADH